MENESTFIGLEWIDMVEKLVGEVARRSYKDGSRAQLSLVIRDRGTMKQSFKKLCKNLSFFTFYQGHRFFLTEIEW